MLEWKEEFLKCLKMQLTQYAFAECFEEKTSAHYSRGRSASVGSHICSEGKTCETISSKLKIYRRNFQSYAGQNYERSAD